MDDLTRRAFSAYFRTDVDGDQPDSATSGTAELAGLAYVVLRSVSGAVVAVYRVRPAGPLKRLRRWPAGITAGRANGSAPA